MISDNDFVKTTKTNGVKFEYERPVYENSQPRCREIRVNTLRAD